MELDIEWRNRCQSHGKCQASLANAWLGEHDLYDFIISASKGEQ